MCGIYGYIGRSAVSEVMKGIKRLEYRGYDSAGIAYFNIDKKNEIKKKNLKKGLIKDFSQNIFEFDSGLKMIKEKGQVSCLEQIVKEKGEESSLAIGHTRWATHGVPSIENSHPHISEDGNWAIVHNGIIENYSEIKANLKGYDFKSETDSEVVVALLQKLFNGNPLETLYKVCSYLKGSWALGVIYSAQPEKIFVARKNSPVVVGYGKDYGVVCSDINSLASVERAFVLDNGQYAVVEKCKAKVFNEKLEEISVKSVSVTGGENASLGKYKHFMLKEIDEIPLAIEKSVCQYNEILKFKKALPENIVKGVKETLIIGCGTAYHASLMGKGILERECQIRSTAIIASEFMAEEFVWNKSTLAIFVSQSGETADTLKALKRCKEHGLKTLAITNVKNSSICHEADFVIYTNAGSEIAVASTKAYNCQVAIFHMLGAYFNSVKAGKDGTNLFEESKNLCKVAKEIEKCNIKRFCKNIAEKIKDSESIYMLGRGVDYKTALEASLKLKEISYIHCEACPAGELKHGTISLITSQTYVFAFVTDSVLKDKSISNLSEVASRGGKVIVITQFDKIGGGFEKVIKLPKIEEKYMSLIAIVYMQLIAYFTSVALGANPDKPRSLAKSVTVE